MMYNLAPAPCYLYLRGWLA